MWSWAGRSILPKSVSWNSGSSNDCRSDFCVDMLTTSGNKVNESHKNTPPHQFKGFSNTQAAGKEDIEGREKKILLPLNNILSIVIIKNKHYIYVRLAI